MSKLMSMFKEELKKNKKADIAEEASFDIQYPTGFTSLDFLNGSMVHTLVDGKETEYRSVGVVDGSSNTFISRPGCGKSTLCTQIIGNLLKRFPESDAYIDDIEGSLPASRKGFLLGLDGKELEERVHIRNTGITTENVYDQIKTIRDVKIANKKDFTYDTGMYDTYGNKIYKLYPTFYFIDSFAMLMPNDISEDDAIENVMAGTTTAKKNAYLIRKISQLLKEANIILFTINHIQDNIQMGFLPNPAQVAGLKTSERLPGGKTAIYLANNMFRLDEKTSLKDSEGFGILGTIVDVTIVKSRTNASKRSVPLVFDKTYGAFDNILSMYMYLKNQGCIGGAGKAMYLENCPDIKFSQKEFKTKLMNSPELQQAFSELSRSEMDKLLAMTKNQEVEEEKPFDLNNSILGF